MAKVFTIPVAPKLGRPKTERTSDPRYVDGQRKLVEAMRYLTQTDPIANREAQTDQNPIAHPGAAIVPLEVPGEPHPLARFVDIFKNDPLIGEWQRRWRTIDARSTKTPMRYETVRA